MKLRNLFLLHAVVALLFALTLLLMPAGMLDLYGISSNAGDKLLAQFFGVQLLAAGLITLFASNTGELRSQRTLTLSLFIAAGVGFVVALGGMLSRVMNDLGWSAVLVYLLFALGFGYFQFFGPAE